MSEGIRVRLRQNRRKQGYPPDKQDVVVKTALEQAEVAAGDWAGQLDG